MGIGFKSPQRIEAGRENLSIESLVKLAKHLRARVTELFEHSETEAGRLGGIRGAGAS